MHLLVVLLGIVLVAVAIANPIVTAVLFVVIGLWWWLDRYRPRRRR